MDTRVSNTCQFKVTNIKVYNVHYIHNEKDDLRSQIAAKRYIIIHLEESIEVD